MFPIISTQQDRRKRKTKDPRNAIVEEHFNYGGSHSEQLSNIVKNNKTNTNAITYKKVDVKNEQKDDFGYCEIKKETFDNCESNFEGEDTFINKEIEKIKGNEKVLCYISKVKTIENDNFAPTTRHYTTQPGKIPKNFANDTLNNQGLNNTTSIKQKKIDKETDRHNKKAKDETGDNEEYIEDRNIKKEIEENEEGTNYTSEIDVHEHGTLTTSIKSENDHVVFDIKPLGNNLNASDFRQEINNYRSILNNSTTEDDKNFLLDIKPVAVLDKNNTKQDLESLKSRELSNLDDELVIDIKPLSLTSIQVDQELNNSRKLEYYRDNLQVKADNAYHSNSNVHLHSKRSKSKDANICKQKKNHKGIKNNNLNITDSVTGLHNNTVERCNTKTIKYGNISTEYKYQCTICNFKTNVKKCIKYHEFVHFDKDVENTLICDYCDYITKIKIRLIKHIESHMNLYRYSCTLCPYKCKYKCSLKSHMQTHSEKPICNICGYKFKHIKYLNNHMKIHTSEKAFQCDLCEKKFTLKQYLFRHIRKHTGQKPYSCHTCGGKFAWKGDLAKHVRIHSSVKYYTCDTCGYKTVDKQTLVKHIRRHTGEKPFKCQYCEYKCSVRSSLRAHENIHTGKRPYPCSSCSYTAKSQGALKSHVRTHTKEKPFKCHLCDYKAAQRPHLTRHVMTHTGEKPFSCEKCSYKCARKCALLEHMKGHTSARPYACKFCEYKCSRKSMLVTHERAHSGIKPYACKLCDYKTTRSSGIYIHMRTHSGEKPYACDLCEYKVTRKKYLQLHMLTHIQIKVNTIKQDVENEHV